MKRLCVALCVVVSGAAPAQNPPDPPLSLYTIPGVVNAAGRNNTRFVSDLALTNSGTSSADVVVSFVPAGALEDQEVSLSPGRTIVWRNVLQQLWGGAEASGAVLVTSDKPLLVRARTYNTATSGTFGVALPAVPEERLLSAGETAQSLWISQSADATRDFRTNIAVAFPDAGGGAAHVALFDTSGAAAGEWDFSSASAGFQQVSVGSIAGSLAVGRAEIAVRAGRATAYASVVDNVTGDSSLFPFSDLAAGPQDVLVNGVARANGRNGTFFRTDARLYNPGPDPASLAVSFLPAGTANTNPATATVSVPAGRILEVVDVLGAWFSAPAGSAGALRLRSDVPVALFCRTSNVDPNGARPGTYGAQQLPRPLPSFLSSADAGALVTGVRQNSGYRTNVGFAAGPDGAAWRLSLRTSRGVEVATFSDSLGAFGWRQPNVLDLFPGAGIPEDAQIFVDVTSGSLDVFDSSIDNASGDSVVSGFDRIPVSLPSSATIGPGGGSVASEDGLLTVRIPAGALAAPSMVSIAAGSGPYPDGVGPGWAVTLNGSALAKPALATLRYSPDDLSGSAAGFLGLGEKSGSSILGLPGAICDAAARTVSAPFGGGAPPSLKAGGGPLTIFRFEIVQIVSLRISPSKAGVLSGGTVQFRVTALGRLVGGTSVTPIDLNPEYVDWSLRAKSGSPAGSLYGLGGSATYTAPSAVTCAEPIEVVFEYQNPGRKTPYRVTASVQLLARYWDLIAESDVNADYCGVAIQNAVTFSLKTDQVTTILTLNDDLTFSHGRASKAEFQGKLGASRFCPSKGCSVSWAKEPVPQLTFDVSQGGWANGRLYFSFWGFLLNETGLKEWILQVACGSGGSGSVPQLQPNCAGTPVTTPPLLFDGPDPKDGCNARKTFTWKEFQRWIKVGGKSPFDRSAYRIVLTPRS